MNIIRSCFAVVLAALVVAGCSDSDTAPVTDPGPTPLEQAQAEHAAAVAALEADHAAAMMALEEGHAAAVMALEAQHEADMMALETAQTDNAAAIAALEAQHEADMMALRAEHATAMATLEDSHAAAIMALDMKVAGLEAEIMELRHPTADAEAMMMAKALSRGMTLRNTITSPEALQTRLATGYLMTGNNMGPLGDEFSGEGEYQRTEHLKADGSHFKETTLAYWSNQESTLDDDYIQFGYWLTSTTKNGMESYTEVGSFYTGGNAQDNSSLQGMAKYAGPATGHYVKKSFSPEGNAVPTSSGEFTADAMLTAYFGGPDVAMNKHFSIAGEVTNFMDDGMAIDSRWSLMLMGGLNEGVRAKYSPFMMTGVNKAMTKSGIKGDMSMAGNLHGRLLGKPDMTMTPTDATDNYPSAAAFRFDGHFMNGHVVGAAGLTMMTE